MKPSAPRQGSKKDQLYEALKRQVLTMEFEPGMSLDEASLGSAFGLSRTPVREVLRQLAGEGYLKLEENRGAFVAPMTHKTLRSFFRTAPAVYASIAGLAVENHTSAQLEELRATQDEFRAATEAHDANRMSFCNNRFHLIMGEMADNPYMLPSLQRLLIDHTRIGQTFYRPRNRDMSQRLLTACEHHDAFIVAIENGEVEAARLLAHEHWELSRNDIELFVRPEPLEIDLGSHGVA